MLIHDAQYMPGARGLFKLEEIAGDAHTRHTRGGHALIGIHLRRRRHAPLHVRGGPTATLEERIVPAQGDLPKYEVELNKTRCLCVD